MAAIPPLAQLLNAQTPAQIQAAILQALTTAGLPVSSWSANSLPTFMVQSESLVLSDLQQQIVNLGSAGYFQLATTLAYTSANAPSPEYVGTSPWVDLGAQQFYNQFRLQPQVAIGPFNFTAAAGAGPYQISAGQLQITDAAGDVFTNIGAFTFDASSSLVPVTVAATVTALVPGAQANIANGTALTLTTQLAGVTVTTSPSSGATPWYVSPLPGQQAQAGTNLESDASLIARCLNQWSAMGTGSPAGAWLNWIFAASNEVRYALTSPTGLGSVRVTVYGNNGPVSPTGLAAIAAYLAPRIPQGLFIAPGFPVNAGTVPINPLSGSGTYATFSATLYGPSNAQSSARVAAANALTLLIQATPLGGRPISPGTPDTFGISNAAFVDAIMNSNSAITKCVVSVTNNPSGPAGAGVDLLLPPTAGVPTAAQPPPSLTPMGWGLTWVSV